MRYIAAVTTIAAAGANVSLRANPKLAFTVSVVPGQPGAWIISSEGVNAAGQPVSIIPAACEPAISGALGESHRSTNPGTSGSCGSIKNTCSPVRYAVPVT